MNKKNLLSVVSVIAVSSCQPESHNHSEVDYIYTKPEHEVVGKSYYEKLIQKNSMIYLKGMENGQYCILNKEFEDYSELQDFNIDTNISISESEEQINKLNGLLKRRRILYYKQINSEKKPFVKTEDILSWNQEIEILGVQIDEVKAQISKSMPSPKNYLGKTINVNTHSVSPIDLKRVLIYVSKMYPKNNILTHLKNMVYSISKVGQYKESEYSQFKKYISNINSYAFESVSPKIYGSSLDILSKLESEHSVSCEGVE